MGRSSDRRNEKDRRRRERKLQTEIPKFEFTWDRDALVLGGPVITTMIGVAGAHDQALRAASQPVPPPIKCQLLLDTGAGGCVVKHQVGRWTDPENGRKFSTDPEESISVRTFKFVVERDPDTGHLVGYVPGWPGAHTQGADIDELQRNLGEVIAMLLEDGEPVLESEFVDVRTIQVA
jgi:predicted RNase H-like HicB family nuclease